MEDLIERWLRNPRAVAVDHFLVAGLFLHEDEVPCTAKAAGEMFCVEHGYRARAIEADLRERDVASKTSCSFCW